jgi:hypothetical protein
MNPFTAILGVFVLVRLFNKFMDGYTNSTSPINTIPTNSSVIHLPTEHNYANSNRISNSLLHYYSSMLKLNQEREINIDVIDNNYYEIVKEIEHNRDLGLRVDQNIHDLIAAREYMTDMCRYFGNRN